MAPLLAYAVQRTDERTGGIVFAPSNAAARRKGAGPFNFGELDGLEVRRQPWADSFAPGPVPFREMLEHGWWQECQGCGIRMEQDACGEDGRPIRLNIVEDEHGVFCRPGCQRRFLARRRAIKAGEARAIAMLQQFVVSKLGKVTFEDDHHAYVDRLGHRTLVNQVIVRFRIPGLKHGSASCRLEQRAHTPMAPYQPLFYVANGDADTFRAWREQRLLDLRATRGDAPRITTRQKSLIRHAIGLPSQRRRSYRNRFVTSPGTQDHIEWMEMAALGLAYHAPASTEGGMDWFFVTHAGARAALEAREKLCPEDFPPIL